MKRSAVIAASIAFGLGGLVGAFALLAPLLPERSRAVATPSHPDWTEVQWPFPTDEWGKGKAFRCNATDCGAEVNLYIRAKIGFCNCTTGVQSDGRQTLGFGCWPSDQCCMDEGPQPALRGRPSISSRTIRVGCGIQRSLRRYCRDGRGRERPSDCN